ncbi:MAG: tRNA (N6-isopentenyl adenosine(37)-C2)-methylthiotransferase MiaB [Candidatus Kapaibacteriales bacterium]
MFIDLMPEEKVDSRVDIKKLTDFKPSKSKGKGTGVRKFHIETYGCQMNVADSEIVAALLKDGGYDMAGDIAESDVILLNTCSIRENAEKKIYNRLRQLRYYKKRNAKLVVGIIGCMAERLKDRLIGESGLVKLVVGPDEYRALPALIDQAFTGEAGIAVKLSKVETYEDIAPLRTEGISAWLSIMRGCNNFCAFCVVPYTRGRERSRTLDSVVRETVGLWESGIKEVTLLGQNVNSYKDKENGFDFPKLLTEIAEAVPEMRIRYTTSHPHDMSDGLIRAHADYDNICNYLHLPVQSGSDKVLKKMRRDYNAEKYLQRIAALREAVPNMALSTDIIAGFCTETEDDHKATLDLMAEVRYDGAYMFKYSERENTLAEKYEDDVPEEVKLRRLNEIIEQQNKISAEINKAEQGTIHKVLVEGPSKKNDSQWQGRSDTNKVCIFDYNCTTKVGDTVTVRVKDSTSATLFCEMV